MKKLFKYKLVLLFTLLIVGITIFDIVGDVDAFSEIENRALQQKPKVSKESILANEFTMKYEDYIDDQFVARDTWINIKSRIEFALGKIENNGVVYGQQNYMFEKYQKTNEERIKSNTEHIQNFIKGYNGNVTVGIIPSSYVKNESKLPLGLNNVDQNNYIDEVYDKISQTKNLNGAYAEVFNMEETPLEYYRTDHHWTTIGAHKAYSELMEQLDKPFIHLERGILGDEVTGTYGLIDVGEFYGTYYNKTKAFHTVPDQLGYFDIPITQITIDGVEQSSLYDYGKLATRDKYGMFLHGNNGVTVISSDNLATLTKEIEAPIVILNTTDGSIEVPTEDEEGILGQEEEEQEIDAETGEPVVKEKSRVLLIKDSYGNCFAPYLTYSFDEVVVVDLRFMNKKMSEFIKEKRYDEVIVLYNFMNFAQDANLGKISR